MDNTNIFGNDGAAQDINPEVPSEPTQEQAPVADSALTPDFNAAPEQTVNPASEQTQASVPFAATMTPEQNPVTVQSMPVQQPMSDGVAPMQPQKKKGKGGLIAGILAGVIILGGGGGAAVYYTMHEKPERMLKDGLEELISLDAADVTINLYAKQKIEDTSSSSFYSSSSDDIDVEDVTLNAHIASKGENRSGDGTVTIKLTNGSSFDISAQVMTIGDSAVYFKVGDLSNVLDEAVKTLNSSVDDEDSAALISKIVDALKDSLKEVENQWFEIKTSEIEGAQKVLSCVNEKSDALKTDAFKKEVTDLFEQYPFLSVNQNSSVATKNGLKYILVDYDKTNAKSFSDELEKLPEMKALSECTEDAQNVIEDYGYEFGTTRADKDAGASVSFSSSLTSGVDASDLENFNVGIKSWSHEIEKIEANIKPDDDIESGNLNITIKRSVSDITAPTDTKSLDDLKNIVKSAVEKMNAAYREAQIQYLENACKQMYTGDNVQKCVEQYKEYYIDDDASIFDMF